MPSQSRGQPAESAGEAAGASLEEVLDAYLQELADGGSPDPERYIRAHPDLADALRGVFRTIDFIETTSRSLNAAQLEKGARLGEYRITREVARGGMGVVYEAVQVSLGRRVALKVLPAGGLLSPTAAERFAREAAAAGQLHHTNIVPVYAVGQEQGIRYYAMQYIDGHSLAEHLRQLREHGFVPTAAYFRRVARWGAQAADALACAHAGGILHRDVKPSNLLLDRRDNIWLTDFGLARVDALTSLTLTGDVVGTARYMSPEQARGQREVDARCDIYSLGATLYELLTLQPAVAGECREEVLNRIARDAVPPVRQIDRAIPRDLETIVAKCMERDPQQRYRSAEEVAADFRAFLAGDPIRARRTPLLTKAWRKLRRHRMQAGAALVTVALLVAIAMFAVKLRHEQGRRKLDEAYSAFLFEHDEARALRLLNEAERLGGDETRLLLYRGLIPLFRYEPQRAVEPLEQVLRADPDNIEAGYALAYACCETGDTGRGQACFRKVAGREIHTALGWLLRGLALRHLPYGDVIDAFNQAIALRPDFIPALQARSEYRAMRLLTEARRDDLDPMLEDFNARVVFRPNSCGAYSARAVGWLYAAAYARTQPDLQQYADKWLDNCRADFARALERGGAQRPLVLSSEGVYLRYVGRYEESARVFAEAIDAGLAAGSPRHPGLVHQRVLSLHAAGRVEAALREVASARKALPSFYPLALQEALLLAEHGEMAQARELCRRQMRGRAVDATSLAIIAAVANLLGDGQTASGAVADFLAEPRHARMAEPALDYLAGKIDADTLRSGGETAPGRRCELEFVVALRELGRGNRTAGLAALRACLDTEVFIYVHYRLAEVIMARIRSDPSWPPWLPSPAGERSRDEGNEARREQGLRDQGTQGRRD